MSTNHPTPRRPTESVQPSPDRWRTNDRRRRAKLKHDAVLHDRYRVEYVPISEISPSPENDSIYGHIEHDEQMDNLIESIRRRGLEEPLILTEDGYVLSGHRRLYAVAHLGWSEVPCRFSPIVREGNHNYHRDLIEYNPQRIKKAASLLKEALLRDCDADTHAAIARHDEASMAVDADFMEVRGAKLVEPISDKKQQFLSAVKQVIEDLKTYWPLSIRQIHYRLLNDPPLTLTPKRSKFDSERYRYRNDKQSYQALVRLLTSARYHGEVSMACIDDPTRPQRTFDGWNNVSEFIQEEVDCFLLGYHRDRQQGQPRHIEVFGEKSTLKQMIHVACEPYYVPYSLGRGYCTIPVWRDIAKRFHESGRKRMTLIVVSDYDPDGLELADDAIRSLEQLWEIPVDGHRIAVTREQVDELDLSDDFNPAKATSSRYKAFVERTGGEETWEVEALEPDYLVDKIKAAIEANMDMEIYRRVLDQEKDDCDQLAVIRREIANELYL